MSATPLYRIRPAYDSSIGTHFVLEKWVRWWGWTYEALLFSSDKKEWDRILNHLQQEPSYYGEKRI